MEFRVDFSSENILPDGNNFGYVGEHNAATLVITPPASMTDNAEIKYICLACEVGNDYIKSVVHSQLYEKAAEIRIPLWSQATISESAKLQLEAYDGNEKLLIKSELVDYVLSPSAKGTRVVIDAKNNFVAILAANTAARHTHTNQRTVLDLLEIDRDGIHLLLSNYGTLAYVSDVPNPVPANDINNYFVAENPVRNGYIGPSAVEELIDQIKARFATKELVEGLSSPLRIELVEVLPETGEEGVIYLVPSEQTEFNVYKEYLFVNGSFELIGSTQIDLTGYAKTEDISTEIDTALAEAKASGEFDGADGYTPIKGVDYFTESDKVEFVELVLEALPAAEGVGF